MEQVTAVLAGLQESPKKIITYTWLGTLVNLLPVFAGFHPSLLHIFCVMLHFFLVYPRSDFYCDVHCWLMFVPPTHDFLPSHHTRQI
jgi:hypothetical protein